LSATDQPASGSRTREGGARRAGALAVAGSLGVAVALGYGAWTFLAESSKTVAQGSAGQEYGIVSPSSEVVPVSQVLADPSSTPVTVTGTVVDMGPTMGCWLVIDDGSGQVLVQTDPMTFVEQSVKGKTITATGQMTVLDGGMGFSGERPALLTNGITVNG
jgi:uncharacterized protein YdeI (BOF family)